MPSSFVNLCCCSHLVHFALFSFLFLPSWCYLWFRFWYCVWNCIGFIYFYSGVYYNIGLFDSLYVFELHLHSELHTLERSCFATFLFECWLFRTFLCLLTSICFISEVAWNVSDVVVNWIFLLWFIVFYVSASGCGMRLLLFYLLYFLSIKKPALEYRSLLPVVHWYYHPDGVSAEVMHSLSPTIYIYIIKCCFLYLNCMGVGGVWRKPLWTPSIVQR